MHKSEKIWPGLRSSWVLGVDKWDLLYIREAEAEALFKFTGSTIPVVNFVVVRRRFVGRRATQ